MFLQIYGEFLRFAQFNEQDGLHAWILVNYLGQFWPKKCWPLMTFLSRSNKRGPNFHFATWNILIAGLLLIVLCQYKPWAMLYGSLIYGPTAFASTPISNIPNKVYMYA